MTGPATSTTRAWTTRSSIRDRRSNRSPSDDGSPTSSPRPARTAAALPARPRPGHRPIAPCSPAARGQWPWSSIACDLTRGAADATARATSAPAARYRIPRGDAARISFAAGHRRAGSTARRRWPAAAEGGSPGRTTPAPPRRERAHHRPCPRTGVPDVGHNVAQPLCWACPVSRGRRDGSGSRAAGTSGRATAAVHGGGRRTRRRATGRRR